MLKFLPAPLHDFLFGKLRDFPAPSTILTTNNLLLRRPLSVDWRAWRDLREGCKDYLVPWEPLWSPFALSQNYFTRLVSRQARDWNTGRAFSFLIFQKRESGREGTLIGAININDVSWARPSHGTLGYWTAQKHSNQGYMTEAVQATIEFAFHTLDLDRLDAGTMPGNSPSIRVLQKTGFRKVGFAEAHIRINGKWEDHVLWSRPNLTKFCD